MKFSNLNIAFSLIDFGIDAKWSHEPDSGVIHILFAACHTQLAVAYSSQNKKAKS